MLLQGGALCALQGLCSAHLLLADSHQVVQVQLQRLIVVALYGTVRDGQLQLQETALSMTLFNAELVLCAAGQVFVLWRHKGCRQMQASSQ